MFYKTCVLRPGPQCATRGVFHEVSPRGAHTAPASRGRLLLPSRPSFSGARLNYDRCCFCGEWTVGMTGYFWGDSDLVIDHNDVENTQVIVGTTYRARRPKEVR
jgi:hypothetical protein